MFLHSMYMPSLLQLVKTLVKVLQTAWAVAVSHVVKCVSTDYNYCPSGDLNHLVCVCVCVPFLSAVAFLPDDNISRPRGASIPFLHGKTRVFANLRAVLDRT